MWFGTLSVVGQASRLLERANDDSGKMFRGRQDSAQINNYNSIALGKDGFTLST